MLRAPVTLLVAAALAAGCGGSGGGGVDSALEHLPKNARAVGAADFQELRRSLGLPEDADLAGPAGGSSSGPGRLALAAGTVIPYLAIPQDSPVRRAIDHRRVRAAAGELLVPGDVTVLVTDQPFEDVSEELSARGYRERDGILVSQQPARPDPARAIGGREGLLVVGGSEQVVKKALAREGGGGGPQGDLLERLDGPVRVAAEGPDSGCVRGLGASDQTAGDQAEVVIQARSPPDPARVRLGKSPLGRRLGLEAAEAKRDGDLLRVPVDAKGPPGGVAPTQLVISDVPVSDIYRC